jgi:hypothetical protein
MDTLFEKAVELVRQLPEAEREDIARAMLSLAEPERGEPIDEADRQSVLAAIDQADRGQFASDDDMAETFKRFGP